MIDTLVREDIFFFITSVAVVIITVALVAALFQFILILRDVRHVSRCLREEADRILADAEDLRRFVKKEGRRVIDFKDLISGVIGAFLPKRKSRRRAVKPQTEAL
ncbi:MAG: hypothetical protein A3J30_04705 [Candidatus Wildermuthbacteria bacterium RIFCSPLOWO2_02_FULL_47_9c]|uniref:Uncharacterized protein n=2 Tax=Parcubacteria group TaxID=1794811 RepID=A0A837IL28_9BACT|nr:MAG: hypothetical protein UY25_C0004G0121 [Candidatus Yanofskybacteria bacterium GW2011_GWC1_48_11]KKW04446.1 MAG: hypothetical protein UY38_C0001G0013 [Parcubacteria group bacterium GW2011_GWB1_49_12]KKW08624.1 MAG: hypothetical protein UY45_C0005G0027 [Parcubacteria group bacterium GW2011_GWA1_49_26]KKW13681.1 MAG: hypothetical protein UY53_C0009G0017 [Parcubacteria group bacterium GW2011_GWA2_50_10]OHA61600.1 MAG: hypothetical protein A2109_03680 [Candidatus Wildermuthbacteria bacterium G